jgi:carboxypeptidase Taq
MRADFGFRPPPMQNPIRQLKTRLTRVQDLKAAASLLSWDQVTYMPPGGARARGRQLATLHGLIHDHATRPAVGRLLDALEPRVGELDEADAALVRVARRDFDKAVRVPGRFVARFAAHTARTYETWAAAREAGDFGKVEPLLARTVDLSREYAGFFPGAAHVADPLIDDEDPGVTVAQIRPLFDDLRTALVPLVRAIGERPAPPDGFLAGPFPKGLQLAFGREVVRRFGYDFSRGREDISLHPFTMGLSIGDVRITTRVREDDPRDALFSTLHEAGHGLYEQGIDPALDGLPLADGTSAGLHESQSRLWENQVGRSRTFWEHFYPRFQEVFPGPLKEVPMDAFYRAINRVEPSLIRTDADEVTYNLHVMLRFDLELELLEGRLSVADLPAAWNARMESDLGVTPTGDADGVLQDIHWYVDHVGGAFQGYTLGNLFAAQLFAAAKAHHPEIDAEMAEGRFDALFDWLQANVWRHGRCLSAVEVVTGACGGAPSPAPFLAYLRTKYGALYGLPEGV